MIMHRCAEMPDSEASEARNELASDGRNSEETNSTAAGAARRRVQERSVEQRF
jgi:hypothetical protein